MKLFKLLLGITIFAYGISSIGIYAYGNNEPIISINKEKLSSTILTIWDKAVSFVKDNLDSVPHTTLPLKKNEFVKVEPKDKDTIIKLSDNAMDDGLDDIQDSDYKTFIDILFNKHIVRGHNGMFYPKAHIRLYSFIKMLVESYRWKAGYDLSDDIGLTDERYYDFDFDQKVNKCINTAYELGFLNRLGDDKISESLFEKVVSYTDLKILFYNIYRQFPGLVNKKYMEHFYASDVFISREKASEYTVKFFDISYSSGESFIFDDTKYNKYGVYIEKMAELGLVNTGNSMFYPDKKLYRIDFAVIMSRFLKDRYGESDIENLYDIVDIKGKAYYNDVMYAYDLGVLDYLLEVRRGNTYLLPSKTMTKHEVYHILNQISDANIVYDEEVSDKEFITRGEFAYIFVQSFNLLDENIEDNKSKKVDTLDTKIVEINREEKPLVSFLKNIFMSM